MLNNSLFAFSASQEENAHLIGSNVSVWRQFVAKFAKKGLNSETDICIEREKQRLEISPPSNLSAF